MRPPRLAVHVDRTDPGPVAQSPRTLVWPRGTPLRGYLALRISAGCDRGEQVPVGSPGVEQHPDPEVRNRVSPNVQTEGGALAASLRVVIDQGGAIGDDGVVDGVPVSAELDGHLVDRAAPASDLFGHPPPGPVPKRQARRCKHLSLRPSITRPGTRSPHSSIDACATSTWPGVRTPAGRPAPPRGDPSPDLVLYIRHTPAARLGARHESTADPRIYIGHADEPHLGQANEQFAGADRVADHRGSPSEGVENRQTGRAPATHRGPSDSAPFRSAP